MKNRIFFYTFIIIWVILIVLNFLNPKVEFSENENRVLAKIPRFTLEKLIDGSYAQGLDNYINDHFIFRDKWMNIQAVSELITLKYEVNGVYVSKDGRLFAKFNYGDKEKDNVKSIANNINKFAMNDFNIYFMLVPNSIYINKDKLPSNLNIKDQSEIINTFYNLLNPNILKVDVIPTLMEHNSEYIYYRTDHHMTSLGTYYTYLEFCKKANLEPTYLNEYNNLLVSNSFLGTFDSKANIPFTKPDDMFIYQNKNNTNLQSVQYDNETTTSIFNTDYLNKKDKYSFFLNGNNAKVVVKTKVNNGKKLLVIKDSYANIMAQFLCNNYEEIHFIDPRYNKASISDYAKLNSIKDILFLYNVSNITTDLGLKTLR